MINLDPSKWAPLVASINDHPTSWIIGSLVLGGFGSFGLIPGRFGPGRALIAGLTSRFTS